MDLIAKIKENTQNNEYYELFKLEDVEDAEGNIVKIKQSIGTFSLNQLNSQKEILQKNIDKINEKIETINNL